MSCEGARMADQSAGRVSLHSCFPLGLWTASTEITGEGGTPALFCLQDRRVEAMSKLSKTTVVVLAVMIGMLIFVTGCGRVEWECVKGDGAVTITGIKGGAQESPSGELKIPESIDGVTVRAIAPGAFRGYGRLTSVEIPPSVVRSGKTPSGIAHSCRPCRFRPASRRLADMRLSEPAN